MYKIHIVDYQGSILNFFQKDLENRIFHIIFVSVFHRILDFKAGLDFYLGPFFLSCHEQSCLFTVHQPRQCINPSLSVSISSSEARK